MTRLDATKTTRVFKDNDGDRLVIDDGGTLKGVSGSTIELDSISIDNAISGSTATFSGEISGGTATFGGSVNYSEFEPDGTLKANGDATTWDDIRVPLSSIKRLGFSDPSWEKFKDDGSGSAGVYSLAFQKLIDEEVYFSVQIPHSWKLGSDLFPHVHWSPSDTDTGNVIWGLEYTIANITGTFGNTTIITVTDAADGTAYKHQIASFNDIDMSGYTDSGDVSIMLMCRLFRDASSDTYDNKALLLEIDFHFEQDTIGSRQETIK